MLKKMRGFLLRSGDPIVIILAALIAYAPQTPWLGFVIDDWAYIDFAAYHGVEGLLTYTTLIDARPFAFWIPWLGFNLFGTHPLPWQLWTLGWNILAAVMVWLVLRRLFPHHRQQNLLTAILFSVYPLFFTHITSALQLSVHAVCYFLIALSFYLTIRAVHQPKAWLVLTAGAILASVVQLFSIEYFAGLELARGLVLFFLMSQSMKGFWKRIAATAKQWLPYLLVWGFWAVWRVALMPRPLTDRNTPVLLQQMVQQPLPALAQLLQTTVQDTVQILVGVWARTDQYANFSFTPISNLAAWGVGLLAAGLIALWLWLMRGVKDEKPYPLKAALGGLAAIWLSFLPVWAIGEKMAYFTVNADRYGMAATAGAVLLLAAGAGLLLRSRAVQNALLILLIGLGTAFQFRILGEYRRSWEQQMDFYWQLKWRAPQLAAPTALIGNGQLIPNLGSWFLTPAIDHLYAAERPNINPLYYYFDAEDVANPVFLPGTTRIATTRYQRQFTADANQTLALQYDYGSKRCLWILSAADAENPYLEESLKPYLKFSNMGQVQPGSDLPADTAAFGKAYPQTWCYYFQKAELVEQFLDWQAVLSLWRQAEQKGFTPRYGVEYAPFIRAAALTGDWTLAQSLTLRAYAPKEQMQGYLCSLWKGIEQEIGASSSAQVAGIKQLVECK